MACEMRVIKMGTSVQAMNTHSFPKKFKNNIAIFFPKNKGFDPW